MPKSEHDLAERGLLPALVLAESFEDPPQEFAKAQQLDEEADGPNDDIEYKRILRLEGVFFDLSSSWHSVAALLIAAERRLARD